MSISADYREPDSITVRVEADLGGAEEPDQTGGEITTSCEEWLDIAVGVLAMLPGKLKADGTEYILGPDGVEPEMIGQLVAVKLRAMRGN